MLLTLRNKLLQFSVVSGNPFLYIAILVAVIVVFTTYRSLTQVSLRPVEGETFRSDIPLLTIYNPYIEVFNKQGKLAYVIKSSVIEQYETPATTVMQQPQIDLFESNATVPWHISGRQIEYTSSHVRLSGDVIVTNEQKQMTVHTEVISYDTQSQVIRMPQQSEVEHRQACIEAGSMAIHMRTNELTFSDRVVMKIHDQNTCQ